ncbi:MAG: hypothetical protein Q8N09_12260, partial [Thermodesulfovibrionia bacterium]|nr:hypothetical protein [Thermodesulfovibrionia bacterium]
IIGGSGSGWNPENPAIKVDVMMGSLLYDGLLNYYFQSENTNPLKEKVFDVLDGISEFMYHEPYFEGVKKGRQVQWIPYVYNLSDKNKSKHDYKLAGQASFCIIIPYLFTGEERWIDKAKKMIKTAIIDNEVWGSYGYIDHPGYQTIAYLILKNYKVEQVNQANAFKVDYKNGRIYLSWTVPEGVEGYRIKYSNKKIVRYLQYDTDSKTFKYPPESFINWWSAENIKDEPVPLLPGNTQSYSFVPEHGTYYFALRTIKGDMVGEISNEVEVEVR